MRKDYAISSKPIPETVWVLIFTSLGKYFFFNSKTGERCWIPPESVIKTLKEKYSSPSKREMFFDPFYQEEEEGVFEGEDEDDEVKESESETDDNNSNHDSIDQSVNNNHKKQPVDDENAEDEFKLYLLKNSVDPFAPWPTILSLHSTSPQFQAIPSDKRRQDLFAQVCPLLIDQKREEKRKRLEEAEKWWDGVRGEYLKMGWSWFQVIKKVKGNNKFSLLNEKECEKEYKNLLNKRK